MHPKISQEMALRDLGLTIARDWLIIHEFCPCPPQVRKIHAAIRSIVAAYRDEVFCGCEDCVRIASKGIQTDVEQVHELLVRGLHYPGSSSLPGLRFDSPHDN